MAQYNLYYLVDALIMGGLLGMVVALFGKW